MDIQLLMSPNQARQRLGMVGVAKIVAVAASPDGQIVALGYDDGVVSVRRAATGEPLIRLLAHPSGVGRLAFAPDSSHLLAECGAGSGESSVSTPFGRWHWYVWAIANWELVVSLDGVGDSAGSDPCLANDFLVHGDENRSEVVFRRFRDGRSVQRVPLSYHIFAVSPDASRILFTEYAHADVRCRLVPWRRVRGESDGEDESGHVVVDAAHTGILSAERDFSRPVEVAWSFDGFEAAIAYPDRHVLMTNVDADGYGESRPAKINVTDDRIGSVLRGFAFKPLGEILAAWTDVDYLEYDPDGVEVASTGLPAGFWLVVPLADHGCYLALTRSGELIHSRDAWRLPSLTRPSVQAIGTGSRLSVVRVETDRTAWVIDLASGKVEESSDASDGLKTSGTTSPFIFSSTRTPEVAGPWTRVSSNGRWILSSDSGRYEVFDLSLRRVLYRFNFQGRGITSCAICPETGRVAFGDREGRVTVFDREGRCLPGPGAVHQGPVTSLALSNGFGLSGGLDGPCLFWTCTSEGFFASIDLEEDDYATAIEYLPEVGFCIGTVEGAVLHLSDSENAGA